MNRKKTRRPPRIYVAIPTSGKDGQLRMAGIFRYLRDHHPWNIRLIRSRLEFNRMTLQKFIDDGMDGFIVAIPHALDEIKMLEKLGLPVVLMTSTLTRAIEGDRISHCIVDNEAIGQFAAQYFLSHGLFNAAAYVPDARDSQWSREREAAFAAAIGRRMPFFSYAGRPTDPAKGILSETALGDWLATLPRPTAILAANDNYASQLLNVCRAKQIKVPESVSVIGVDNDELLAENATPQLSSIEPDFEMAGFKAASEMDRLVSMPRNRRGKRIVCGVKRLVERDSSAYLSPSARLVANALQFIRAHAADGISTDDIVRQLRVSRSLVELRMRQVHGTSLATALRNHRLEIAKNALAKTKRPIGKVLVSCGFGNVRAAENLFKARFGMTPSQWRCKFGT